MRRRSETREQRVNRVGRKLAKRRLARIYAQPHKLRPMMRAEREGRPAKFVAYDLETTRIRAGETPEPLYLTAFCEEWQASIRIHGNAHLSDVLENRFLTPENNKVRFVAWNGNNFDVYLIALALLEKPDYLIRPYLTRSKNLRGLRVEAIGRKDRKGKKLTWEFLDGISMTGLTGKPLKDFLKTFAPDFAKLDAPDWEREGFDARNPRHVAYAERDSEGLYRGLMEAERIMRDTFGFTLRPTIGNLGIRIFQSRIPMETTIWAPSLAVQKILREQVMRGGYCQRARRYDGPVWKYDLNQAYAAAMREAKLPAGKCFHSPFRLNPFAKVHVCRVEGTNPRNMIPFYYRGMDGKSAVALDSLPETWITSIEYDQLVREGWRLKVAESYFWDDHFSMVKFVDELEALRASAPGGPSGATGTMVKMIGNNSYGKTVEQLDGIELVMSLDCPDGFSHYQSENDQLQCVWYRFGKPALREYHQPQIGAFITAHVRMVVRRAILLAPERWLYADTDCVAFDKPVSGLPIDSAKYGAWKCEESGTEYWIIEKKVYARKDGAWDEKHVRHAKGMNVKRLDREAFEAWFNGKPPEQTQIQRQNFVKFITRAAPMFSERKKVGQAL